MKFSAEQIDYLKNVFLNLKLDEKITSELVDAIKQTKKKEPKGSELCTAITKSGTRCTKKPKEGGMCTIHLKSSANSSAGVKTQKVKKSEEFVDELSDEDKKKEIEQLFEGI